MKFKTEGGFATYIDVEHKAKIVEWDSVTTQFSNVPIKTNESERKIDEHDHDTILKFGKWLLKHNKMDLSVTITGLNNLIKEYENEQTQTLNVVKRYRVDD